MSTKYEQIVQEVRGLLLDAGTEQNHPDAGDEEHDGDCSGNLHGLFFVQGGLIRTELGDLFLLVIAEVRVDQSHDSTDQQDHSEDDDETFHVASKLPQFNAGLWRKRRRHTSAPESAQRNGKS